RACCAPRARSRACSRSRPSRRRGNKARALRSKAVTTSTRLLLPLTRGRGPLRTREVFEMLACLRAGFIAALMIFAPVFAHAADKPFRNDELADAAVKLEAKIKEDAGTVAKPVATLRREADAAFGRNDFRAGMQILAQIVAVAPQ